MFLPHTLGSMAFLGLLGLASSVSAQVESGPVKDSKVEKLAVFAVTGDVTGKEVDFSEARKENQTVVLFVRADRWDRPVARFVKELDKKLVADFPNTLAVAVWLTDDVPKDKEYLPRAQQSLQFSRTALTVFEGDKNGPTGWAINSQAHLTVVVVDKGKVVESFGFRSVNETDIPAVVKAIPK